MPHRGHTGLFRLPEQADPLKPEIAEHLLIHALEVPDRFEGHIKAIELADIDKRDRKTVLAISEMGQWIDWMLDVVVAQNQQMRQLEAEIVRRKLELVKIKEEQKEFGWQRDILKWLVVTVGAGVIAAGIRWIFGKGP